MDTINTMYNGYHLRTLARLARELDSPINDAFAEFIWRLSNRVTLPPETARAFMDACGYQAFAGFPLKRKTVL